MSVCLLKHLRLRKFQAVFSLQLQRTGNPYMQFIFNASDNEDGDSINFALSQARAPWGLKTDAGYGAVGVSGPQNTAAFTPLTDTTSTMWVRVTNDGTTVSAQWSADVPSAVGARPLRPPWYADFESAVVVAVGAHMSARWRRSGRHGGQRRIALLSFVMESITAYDLEL